MTPEHIKLAQHTASRTFITIDPKLGQITHEEIDLPTFAKMIQFQILDEVLAIARANCILSDSAKELYKDLQAYDRFERGFNF